MIRNSLPFVHYRDHFLLPQVLCAFKQSHHLLRKPEKNIWPTKEKHCYHHHHHHQIFPDIQEVHTLRHILLWKYFWVLHEQKVKQKQSPFSCSAASLKSGNLEPTMVWLRISLCSCACVTQTCKHNTFTGKCGERIAVHEVPRTMFYLSEFGQFGCRELFEPRRFKNAIPSFVWACVFCSISGVNAPDGIPGNSPH